MTHQSVQVVVFSEDKKSILLIKRRDVPVYVLPGGGKEDNESIETAAVRNNVYKQTKYCIEIMKKAIEDAGGSLQNVIRTRIMLVDMSTWKEAAKAHGEFFFDIRPACTFVEVKGFINKEWLVETEADCVISEK